MKRLLSILLMLMMLVTMTGCAKEPAAPSEPDLIKVGISWAMSEDDAKEDEDINAYVDAIKASGGEPVYMVQVSDMDSAKEALKSIDCLVMAGGEDINPALYDEEMSDACEEPFDERDTSDYWLLKAAIELDMPVLATCRGMQMLNVVCGGTLYQDLFTEYDTEINHRDPELEDFTYHMISVEAGTLLADAMPEGYGAYEVNSWHHQGVKDLGEGLKISALGEDNMIEGIEMVEKSFIVGVQFHPEWHIVEETLDCVPVFKALMDASVSKKDAQAISVEAKNGTYVGRNNQGIAEFKGIRYGTFEPYKPAGELNTTSTDKIYALNFGPGCLQPYDDVEIASQLPTAHDCLTLNVWTKNVETKGKPVIMFIHGGSCIWGGSDDPTYDGQFFVRDLMSDEDAVMVTINYRMSILGGLDLSSLEGYSDDYADAMNLSKCDQISALKWIHENIEAFGGDPNNVTIMGQSAGGGAVEMLMADPSVHEYFHRAIVNSGAQAREALSLERFSKNSKEILDMLGVHSIEELINLDDEFINDRLPEIRDAMGVAHPGLKAADGRIISKTWWEDLVGGAASDIDLLIGGTNGEEDWDAIDWDNSVFEPLSDNTDILDGVRERDVERGGAYGRYYSTLKEGFIEGYLALQEDQVKAAMDLHNDVFFNYPTFTFANMQSKNNPNTWFYNWEYAPDMNEVLEYAGDDAEVSPWGRALHCMDLCFELGTKEGYPTMTGDPARMNQDVIDRAREMVYHFALSGDPNNALVSGWLPYDEENRNSMLIGADGSWTNVTNYRKNVMDYLSQLTPFEVR